MTLFVPSLPYHLIVLHEFTLFFFSAPFFSLLDVKRNWFPIWNDFLYGLWPVCEQQGRYYALNRRPEKEKKTPNTTPTARSIVSRPIGHNQTAWLVMPDRKKMWVYGMRRYGFQCLWIVARNWEESSSSSSKKKISYKVSFRLNEFGEKAWDIKKTRFIWNWKHT